MTPVGEFAIIAIVAVLLIAILVKVLLSLDE